MAYVDGYVVPLPKKNVAAYRKIAALAAKVWLDNGAVAYHECVGDDLTIPPMVSFLKLTGAKKTDTVVFAYVVFKSRAQRDKVNKLVMQDPRMLKMMGKKMPFDCARIAYGGFRTLVGG